MKIPSFLQSKRGSALVMSVTAATVLAGLSAAAFLTLESKYRTVHQAASWKEALFTAEGGVEMAVNEIRKDLQSPGAAFQGWQRSGDVISGDGTTQQPIGSSGTVSYSFSSNVLLRSGEGAQRSWAEVTVDAPAFLKDRTGEQWYRIRSRGVAELPGLRPAVNDKQDRALRKFSFFNDRRTGNALTSPQTARTIEAIAKPVGAFRLALFGIASIDMTDHNIVVDSYDSRDSAKSTNGVYDVNKRQDNGDIATNGVLIDAGSAHIYGDALTNGGSVLNPANITGEIRDDFFQEVFAVKAPATTPDAGTPSVVNTATTFDAKAGTPSNYQLSGISLSGSDVLRIRNTTGGPTYCQIVVTGNIAISGNGQIKLDPGVYVRIFVQGDADFSGNGFLNPNSPLNLQVYGCDRPKAANGTQTFGNLKISGNGGFCGSVYAPTYNLNLKGGGNADTIFGAFVGNKITLTGVQSVHYDEALADGGLISDYKIVSWFEDLQ
ncbi:DUF7305 domain-containing protein [Verrucomicrobiota bacterium sgz303538]